MTTPLLQASPKKGPTKFSMASEHTCVSQTATGNINARHTVWSLINKS